MNILLSSYYFWPSIGGVERQTYLLAQELGRRGHSVRIVAARLEGMARRETVAGAEVIRVPAGRGGRYARMGAYLTTMSTVAIRNSQWADVLQVQQVLYPAAAMAVVARSTGRPLVALNAGSGAFGGVRLMESLPGGRLALRMLAAAATVVSMNREMTDELRGAGFTRIREIPTGVEIGEPIGEGERAEARAALGLGDAPTALYLGRFDHEKGVDLCVEAWARRAPAGATLLLAGKGPTEAALRRRVEDLAERRSSIRFLPPTRDVRRLLAAADVFVLPSCSEGISNALLEAMAAGIPALATAVGGNQEVLSSPAVGRLSPRDPDAFGTSLAELLGDRGAARALGEAGRAHVARHFSVATVVDAYEALYAELVAGARRRSSSPSLPR